MALLTVSLQTCGLMVSEASKFSFSFFMSRARPRPILLVRFDVALTRVFHHFCLSFLFFFFFFAGAKQLPFHRGYVLFCLSAWAFIIPYLSETFWKKRGEKCHLRLTFERRCACLTVTCGGSNELEKERVKDMDHFLCI